MYRQQDYATITYIHIRKHAISLMCIVYMCIFKGITNMWIFLHNWLNNTRQKCNWPYNIFYYTHTYTRQFWWLSVIESIHIFIPIHIVIVWQHRFFFYVINSLIAQIQTWLHLKTDIHQPNLLSCMHMHTAYFINTHLQYLPMPTHHRITCLTRTSFTEDFWLTRRSNKPYMTPQICVHTVW